MAELLLFWFATPRGVRGSEEPFLLQGVDGAVLGVHDAADVGVLAADCPGGEGAVLGMSGDVVRGVVTVLMAEEAGVEGAELGEPVFFGVLGLLQAVSVLRVMRRGCDLACRFCGVFFSSLPTGLAGGGEAMAAAAAATLSFSRLTGVLGRRGTGEAVLPLAEFLLPFFSWAEPGVVTLRMGCSLRGVPSSPSANVTKEQ